MYAGKLVHDTTVAAYVLVLRALADAGQFHLLYLIVAELYGFPSLIDFKTEPSSSPR